jgi:phage-related protein
MPNATSPRGASPHTRSMTTAIGRVSCGESLSMPQSRPIQSIGSRCHELRINDLSGTWRVLYRINEDAIVILEVFAKKTGKTPKGVIATCRNRLKEYEDARKRGAANRVETF